MALAEEETTNHSEPKKCGISIDVRMIPSKIAYYVLFSALASIMGYLNVFLVSVGLTISEAGFILAMSFVSMTISSPLMGALADYTGYRRLIFIILCLGFASTIFPLPWVASEINLSTARHYNDNQPFSTNNSLEYISEARPPQNLTEICFKKNHTAINSDKNNGSISDDKGCFPKLIPFSSTLFIWMLVLLFVGHFFLLPVRSFVDSFVTNIITNIQTKETYGIQRMFASLGSGIGSVIAGIMADHYRHPTMSKYTAVFFLFLIFILLLVPLVCVLFKQTNWESEEIVLLSQSDNLLSGRNGKTRAKMLMEILGKLDNIVIILSVLVTGSLQCVIRSFLFVMMEVEMNASVMAMGIAHLVNCLSALVMYPFSKRIITMVGGPIKCIEIGILTWSIRLLTTSYIKNAWLIILPQSLEAFSYALSWAAMIDYIHKISPKEIYITMFAILNSVFIGAGGIIGNIAGGLVFNYYSGPVLFRSASMLACIWIILMFLYFHGIGFIKGKLRSESEIMEYEMDYSV